jgi:PGF-pre-PGF domain-containing protein
VFVKVVAGLVLVLIFALVMAALPGGGPPSVSAVPAAPHIFYGLVTTQDGTPVPAELSIQARIGNVNYAQSVNASGASVPTQLRTHSVNSSNYNYGSDRNFQVCGDDSSSPAKEGGRSGDPITFYVDGIQATVVRVLSGVPQPEAPTISWQTGAVDRVNLIIPSLTAPKAAPATSSSAACSEAAPTPTPTAIAPTGTVPTPTPGTPPPGGGGGFPPPGGFLPPLLPTPTPPPSEVIVTLPPEEAADEVEELFDTVGASEAARVIEQVLEGSGVEHVAKIFENIAPDIAAAILENIAADKAASILEMVDVGKAADIIEGMATDKAARVIENVAIDKAAAIISAVATSKAADIIENLAIERAVSILSGVNILKASDILSAVSVERAAAILEMATLERTVDIIRVMDEARLIERLPEMSPDKLFKLPVDVLFTRLPHVPAEHLAPEQPPQPDPGLPFPTVRRESSTISIHTIAETGEQKWSKLADDRVFQAILGKFARRLTDVSLRLEELANRPGDVPGLSGGRSVGLPYFRIDMKNGEPEDMSAVHMTIAVPKSWMKNNGIHKWSIQLNRYDEQRRLWAPFNAKRVREDNDNIYYTVAAPGFSLFAVSGSTQLPVQEFEVADMDIRPVLAAAGEEVRVTVRVRNTGSSTAVYPANLWINDMVEQTGAVVVEPGQTVLISFAVRKPEGSYKVRVERLMGQFSVGPQRAPTATPVPPTPAPTSAVPTPTQVSAVTTPTPATATPTPAPGQPTPTATPQPAATAAPTATAAALLQSPTPAGASPTPSATPAVTPPPEGGGAAFLGILVGIIAALGVAGAAVFFLMRRRSPSQQ